MRRGGEAVSYVDVELEIAKLLQSHPPHIPTTSLFKTLSRLFWTHLDREIQAKRVHFSHDDYEVVRQLLVEASHSENKTKAAAGADALYLLEKVKP